MTEMTYLTQEGLEKLRVELEDLKKVQRPEAISRIEIAKALGDLSENAEYHEAKDTLAFLEGRIRDIEVRLRDVQIIEETSSSEVVDIGSTIEVSVNGKEKTFQIVGSSEADPANGRISNESPLGSAFLGKKVGDLVEVEAPAGSTVYTVVKIR